MMNFRKIMILGILLLANSFIFADTFVQSKILFKDAKESTIEKVLLLNKKYLNLEIDGKTYYPIEAKYIITSIGEDKIIEQITYSDTPEQFSIKYCFYQNDWD